MTACPFTITLQVCHYSYPFILLPTNHTAMTAVHPTTPIHVMHFTRPYNVQPVSILPLFYSFHPILSVVSETVQLSISYLEIHKPSHPTKLLSLQRSQLSLTANILKSKCTFTFFGNYQMNTTFSNLSCILFTQVS